MVIDELHATACVCTKKAVPITDSHPHTHALLLTTFSWWLLTFPLLCESRYSHESSPTHLNQSNSS